MYIDLSCSSSLKNVTNEEIAYYKHFARKTEGQSITERIEKNLDLSSFNESPGIYPIYEDKVSRSRSKKYLSLNHLKSKKSKPFSSLSYTRYKKIPISFVPRQSRTPELPKSTLSGLPRVMNL